MLAKERMMTLTELTYLDQVIMGERNTSASSVIEWLKSLPKDPASRVPLGVYKHEDTIYRVVEARKSGQRYALKLIISNMGYKWEYFPGGINQLTTDEQLLPPEVNEVEARYPLDQSARYRQKKMTPTS